MSDELQAHMESMGIWAENTAAYTPEQNGMAERLNRTLMERTRTFLRESGLPLSLWGHAMHHANNVRNSVPYSPTKQPPFLYFTGVDPDLSQLHPFGCTAHVHVPAPKRHKLQPKSHKGRYLGTAGPLNSKNFWVLIDSKITVSCDVIFQDEQPQSLPSERSSPPDSPPLPQDQLLVEGSEDEQPDPAMLSSDPAAAPLTNDPAHLAAAPLSEAPLTAASTPAPPPAPPPAPVQAPAPASSSQSAPLNLPDITPSSRGGWSTPAASSQLSQPPPQQEASTAAAPPPQLQEQHALDLLEDEDESGEPPPSPVLTAGGHVIAPAAELDQVPAPEAAEHWQSAPGNRGARRRACGKYTVNSALGEQPRTVTFASVDDTSARKREDPSHTAAGTASIQHQAKAAKVTGFDTDPATVQEALSRPDAEEWEQAIQSELTSLYERQTWEVVPLPKGARAVGCKFVLERKRDGRYKARLVAKGFSQREGIDYNETFAPVSTHATLRSFLSISAEQDLEIRQVDIKTAFLYGDLEEEVYMQHPPGYPGPPGTACRLCHSLYGLKQANRQWHLKLKEKLLAKGFLPSQADPALFIKMDGQGRILAMVYVDDCLIAGKTSRQIEATLGIISSTFEIRDLGEPEDFLGIQIVRDRKSKTISIHQQPYIQKLLADYDLTGAAPKAQPSSAFPEGLPLSPALSTRYPSLVGSLIHLANCTRPDISHLVGALARHLKTALSSHWAAAINLLKYLSGTIDLALVYGTGKGLQGFTDADYGGDKASRRSTTGVVFLLHGAAISWQSKLQPTVSLSTTEAEYQAAGAGAREALWLRKLLPELGFSIVGPVKIYGDNEAALNLTRNQMTTPRSKHIDIVHHFSRERVESKEIVFEYVPSAENTADILTKPLPRDNMLKHVEGLGMRKL